jgi:hypothetical protein
MGALYRLTSPSGKSYIGITTKTTERRWSKHVEHALGRRDAGYLYNALRKHGADSFTVETLVVADDTGYLRDLEKRAIVALGTRYPFCYNVAGGGEMAPGPRSEEVRARISVAQRRRFTRPEERARMAVYGERGAKVLAAKHAANRIDGLAPWEHREKQARLKTQLGAEGFREEHSRRVREALARPEVKARLIEVAKVRAADPAWRAKVSAAKKGKATGRTRDVMTGKERTRRSEGAKRMWERRRIAS